MCFFKQLISFFALIAITCAYPQILIPTSVSHNSGILRNVPSTVLGLGIPVNTILATGINNPDRTTLIDGQTLVNGQTLNARRVITEQDIDSRINNQILEQIAREIAVRLNNNNNQQVTTDQLINTQNNNRLNEQLIEQLDRNIDTINRQRQLLQLQTITSTPSRTTTNTRTERFISI